MKFVAVVLGVAVSACSFDHGALPGSDAPGMTGAVGKPGNSSGGGSGGGGGGAGVIVVVPAPTLGGSVMPPAR